MSDIKRVSLARSSVTDAFTNYKLLSKYMEHKSEIIREMNCKMRSPEGPTSPCGKLKRRSTSHVRSKLNSRALDTEGRNEFKNLYPSYQKRNIRKQASGDIISEDYTQTFVDYDTHQRKHSYTTRIMNKTRKQNP